jgi:hypothetical protein
MNAKLLYSKLMILALTVALFLAACGVPATAAEVPSEPTAILPAPTATPEPVDPATIAQSFFQAYNEGDLEALMALVAEDIKVRSGMYLTGKDRYRFNMQADINLGYQAEISDLKVEGDRVTYNLTVYNNAGSVLFRGMETLQIKDGLIILIE